MTPSIQTKAYRKPHKPNKRLHIFTEGINYFETDEDSIWGRGDRETLAFLRSAKISGRWLNVAAGDGRYNLYLLRKADSVVASDIDRGALSKLFRYTPNRYRPKLETKAFNAVNRFPFKDGSFDGVFCTGFLHLFPRRLFKRMVGEIDRILKPGGKVILDFASDIRRTSLDGRNMKVGSEPKYGFGESKRLLEDAFPGYRVKMKRSRVDESVEGSPPHRFRCTFILLVATKGKLGT